MNETMNKTRKKYRDLILVQCFIIIFIAFTFCIAMVNKPSLFIILSIRSTSTVLGDSQQEKGHL